ncbi:MAG: hypothetical protein L6Q99_18980 [Planctomycetes bacterium]|nr:hypothetical protein [Planctomycetota bacterium]
MRAELGFVCAIFVGLAAPLAAAPAPLALPATPATTIAFEEKEVPLDTSGVTVRVATYWPARVHKGWIPCFVDVRNAGDRHRTVGFRASSWGVDREVNASFDVPAGETSSAELLLPAFANVQNQFNVRLELDGQTFWVPGNFGASDLGLANARSVLYLSAGEPEAGATERWTSELSTSVVVGNTVQAPGALGHLSVVPPPAPTSAGALLSTPDNLRVHHVRFEHLPSRPESYSSVDAVVIDARSGLPEPRKLAALASWMRLGGTVAVFGPRATELARTSAEFAPWLEPRFALARTARTQGQRAGLGTLFVDDAAPFSTDPQREALRWAADTRQGVVHETGNSRYTHERPILPDLFALPYKAFALLLVLFAIVIGPVNFIVVKRFKRPVVLLVTIPVIALGAAVALFGFGVLAQGLGVKLASHTWTVLDQREHRSASSELRMVFAGLAPARGLEPGAGAAAYGIARYSPNGSWNDPAYDGQKYRVEFDPGPVLSGGYLPARTPFLHQTLTERAARGRLEFAREGGALVATNGLGTTVEELLVRDASGGYWTLGAPLGENARGTLEPLAEGDGAQRANDLGVAELTPEVADFPPATYVARLERSPFDDDCGITGTESVSLHRLFGILALDTEAWR